MQILEKNIYLLVSNWIIAQGIESVINQINGFKVVGVTNNIDDFYKIDTDTFSPDICIIYLENDEYIPAIVKQIKADFDGVSTIVLGSDVNREVILQIIASETEVYIYKDCKQSEFFQALNASSFKNKFYCEKILDKMLELPTQEKSCDLIKLTDREVEIIKLITNGKTTKETADILGLSHHTIATHRKNIFRKLEINSGSELVRYALENKLLAEKI
jgi:DNA-binding NarL/FixJ family response regulator